MKRIPMKSNVNIPVINHYIVAANRYLFSLPFGKFCLFIYAFVFIQNGVWSVPNVETVRKMSQHLTENVLTPDIQYLYSSFFGLFLGYVTGASKSHNAFLGIHLLSLTIGFFVLAYQIRKKYGDDLARIVILAFAAVPLCNVLTTWLGTSDVFVYIFGTALTIVGQPLLALLFSFLLGLSHFEQSCFIVLILVFWRTVLVDSLEVTRGKTMLICLSMISGVILAKLSLTSYFSLLDFNLVSNRISFAREFPLKTFMDNYFRNAGVTLFSFQNVFWIFVLALCLEAWKNYLRFFICIIATHALLMTVSMIVLDTTRNFTLMAWPSIILMCVIAEKKVLLPMDDMKSLITTVFLLNLIIPKLIVWEGKIHSSVTYFNFLKIIKCFDGNVLTPFR